MKTGDKVLVRWRSGFTYYTEYIKEGTVIAVSKTQIKVKTPDLLEPRTFRRKADLKTAQYYESIPGGGVSYSTTLCTLDGQQYSEKVS